MTVAELIEQLQKFNQPGWPVHFHTTDGWGDWFYSGMTRGDIYYNASMGRIEIG